MRSELAALTHLSAFLSEDMNDVDEFGMDALTRKRLKVKMMAQRQVKKPVKKRLPARMPSSLKFKGEGLRRRAYIQEGKRFTTPGVGPGSEDRVGYVMTRFYNSVPDFDRSVVETERRKNMLVARGSWPSSGKQVFDWELEVWGERGGAVVVKLNMWSNEGRPDGETFRTTIATVDKLVPKFVRKYYTPIKERMKKEAGVRLGRIA